MLYNLRGEIASLCITLAGAVWGIVFGVPILIAVTVFVAVMVFVGIFVTNLFCINTPDCSLFTIGMWVAYFEPPHDRFYNGIHRLQHAATTFVDKILSLPPEQHFVLISLALVSGVTAIKVLSDIYHDSGDASHSIDDSGR